MKRIIWLSAMAAIFVAANVQAQLPSDAVKLDRVKIPEMIGTDHFCPVHKEFVETPATSWEHAGVTYAGKTDECKTLFAKNADKLHADAERARWELNFVHAMSPIWCPVTDEISPGGNTKWDMIGLTWESCCQFCNDTKTDEDFPRALKILQKRAANAFDLQGAKYVNDASSPVAGAIDLGNGFPDDAVDEEFVPSWVADADIQPTWSGGIGLIVEKRCVECHRDGGAAPMAMGTYGAVKKWSKNLKTHITAGTMPPWPGKPGMAFANAKNLTTKERDAMLAWIEAGYPTGDGEYTPAEMGEWAIGTPDAVIALPEYTLLEAVGEHVKEFDIKTDFDSDKWVIATEARPTDSFLTLEINGGALGSYYRGNSTTYLPEGTGYLIKKGDTIKVRIFYTKEAGWEEFDTDTKFALKFASDSTARKAIQQDRLGSDDFIIPAGKEDASASATYKFEEDAHIVSFNPVLRQRGKSLTITAKFPDGAEKELVAIPRWDINWHFNYTLVEPLAAPKGTVITIKASYDNSEMNVQNPDASVEVKAGPGGELLEGWVSYTLDNVKSAENRFGLSDEELMAATGTCAKCAAACAVEAD